MQIIPWREGDWRAAAIDEVAEAAGVELRHISEDIESGGLLDGDVHAVVDGDLFRSKDSLWTVDGDIASELDLAVAALGIKMDELVGINAGIVKQVVTQILTHSPKAILLIVSNPMDTMTYLALKSSGIDKHRLIGMGGILDSARFKCYLQKELNCSQNDLHATVIGGHGDTTMIPLTRLATLNGTPVSNLLDADQLKQIAADTMVGGATLTKYLGTSAWYAPGAAGAELVESIVRNQRKVFPCCVALEGEYGQNDICLGVPVVIGSNGWEKIIDYKLNDEEQEAFNKSAEAVRSMNKVLETLVA